MFLFISVALADTCGQYGEAEELPPVEDKAIDEASGIVELRSRPGVWVTHNDAGGVPAIYTFSLAGELLQVVPVLGATHRDWEDIAAGPCPLSEGRCLFIGDIGDNARDNEEVTVYAVPEPAEGAASVSVEATWTARWPGAPADSEALVYHPCTERLLLLTKTNSAPAEIWALPAEPGDGELALVGTLDLSGLDLSSALITGADWDDAGERVVVRTYSSVLEWHTDPDDPLGHWSDAPDHLLRAGTGQIEAVAYGLNGDIISASEGELTRVFRLACEDLTAADACAPDDEPADTGGDSGAPKEPLDSGAADSASPVDTDTDAPKSTAGEAGGCGRRASVLGLLLVGLAVRLRSAVAGR